MNKKLNEKYLKRIKHLSESIDPEFAHITADDILCDLLLEIGYKDLVNEFYKIEKWYA